MTAVTITWRSRPLLLCRLVILLLATLGAQSFPWALLVLLIPAIFLAWKSQQHGFPPSGVLI